MYGILVKNKGCLIKTGRNDLGAHKTNTVDRFEKREVTLSKLIIVKEQLVLHSMMG